MWYALSGRERGSPVVEPNPEPGPSARLLVSSFLFATPQMT
jgi:hypothetical protein